MIVCTLLKGLKNCSGFQSQVEAYQKLIKIVLDTSLLNTQHYNVRIKVKVEQSREKINALPYTLM